MIRSMRMPRKLLLFSCLVVALLAWAHGRASDRAAGGESSGAIFRSQGEQVEWQGVASCGGAGGCHDQAGPVHKKFRAVNIWEKSDKHARTYLKTLHDERSKQIVKNLKGLKTLQEAKPESEKLCLHCHSMERARKRGKRFSPDEGVGCEICHGPAQNWLADHQRDPWKKLNAQQKEQRGFRPLKDLEVRASVCVDCHVGSPAASVDHDLIAAGHPRLMFEFGAYHANLPKHWEMADDKKDRKDFEIRLWLTGQAASAEAAVELLERRAKDIRLPWPEFAEYDCFACHHALREPSWRRERGFGGRTPGSLSWGTWYFTMPRMLAGQQRLGTANLPPELDKLAKAMTKLTDRDAAAALAGTVHQELQQWRLTLRAAGPLDADARPLLKALIDAGPQAARTDWESAVQLYLAIAAANDALSDLDPKHPSEDWKKALNDLFKQVDLETRYDSPRRYSPGPIEERLKKLRERLKG